MYKCSKGTQNEEVWDLHTIQTSRIRYIWKFLQVDKWDDPIGNPVSKCLLILRQFFKLGVYFV